MAMITCPECGKQISDQAVSCPNCGYVLSKRLKRQAGDSHIQSNRAVRIVTGSLALLLLCLVVAVSFYNWGLSVGKKDSFVDSSGDSLSELPDESLNSDGQQLSSAASTQSGAQQSQPAAVSSGASQSAQESSIEIISERFHTWQGLGDTTYTVYLAEVLNTGTTNVGLSSFSLDLEDVDGKLLNAWFPLPKRVRRGFSESGVPARDRSRYLRDIRPASWLRCSLYYRNGSHRTFKSQTV